MFGRLATCFGSNWLSRSTIISGQKPARRKRKHVEENRRKVLLSALRFAGVILVIATVVVLPGYIAGKIQTGFKSLVSSRVNRVEFLGAGGSLAEFDRESLQSKISEAADAGASLDDLARIAGSLAPLAKVEIIRAAPGKIIVGFERRTPSLRIDRSNNSSNDAGAVRLVDSAGFIYGSCCVLPVQEAESLLPLLTGLPAADQAGNNKEEHALIREALKLYDGLTTKNIKASSIRYQNHRGFFAIMDPGQIEVSIGRAPFDEKLNRLAEVLERVDRQKVSRIELDYHGKAFIKERKL